MEVLYIHECMGEIPVLHRQQLSEEMQMLGMRSVTQARDSCSFCVLDWKNVLGYLLYRTALRTPGFAPWFSLGQHPRGVNGGITVTIVSLNLEVLQVFNTAHLSN